MIIPPWIGFFAATLLVLASPAGAFAQKAAPACGKPFQPSARVAGSPVTLPPSGARVTMPAGWGWQPQTDEDGAPFILVSTPAAGPSGFVILAASDEGADQTLEQHATETGNQLAGAELGRIVVSRNFSLRRDCGLQVIFRTPSLEGYVVIIRNGSRTYVVASRYPLDAASEMRAGLDTIVASAVLSAPSVSAPAASPPSSLAQNLLGCWSGNLEGRASVEYTFNGDGTYRDRSTLYAPGLSFGGPTTTWGRYQLNGDSITMAEDEGQTRTLPISLQSGLLRIGPGKYSRCN